MLWIVISNLAAVLIAAVAVVVMLRRRRSRPQPGSFRDWIQNPEYRRGVAELFAEADRARSGADALDEAEIEAMVERLLGPEDDFVARRTLDAVGERAVPFLIAALDDPRCAEVSPAEDRNPFRDRLSGTPLNRILNLLADHAPSEAVGPLLRLSDISDDGARREVVSSLARIGTDQCIAPVLAGLGSESSHHRNMIMRGIIACAQTARGTDAFHEACFDAIASRIRAGEIDDNPVECLLALDRDRAIHLVSEVLDAPSDARGIRDMVSALNKYGITLPRTTIDRLRDAAGHDLASRAAKSANGALLLQMVRAQHPGARDAVLATVDHPDPDVAKRAIDPFYELHGLPYELIMHAFRGDSDDLPDPVLIAEKAMDADGGISNGGMAAYFVNGYARHHEETVRGYNAIGDHERARIIREAASLLGMEKNSDLEVALARLAKLDRKDDPRMEQLSSAYYRVETSFDVLLARYLVRHRGLFPAEIPRDGDDDDD